MLGLGPHGGFIVASYVAAVLVIGGLILRAVLDYRAQKAALAALEERGARRRSERGREGAA
ncbi:heme exporter protein CcmD [Alsobacter sp. R-9]